MKKANKKIGVNSSMKKRKDKPSAEEKKVKNRINDKLKIKDKVKKQISKKKEDNSNIKIKKPVSNKKSIPASAKKGLDLALIKKQVEEELNNGPSRGSAAKNNEELPKGKGPKGSSGKDEEKLKQKIIENKKYIITGVPGLDELFSKGIPRGYSILVAGGAGSGKTILSLQILENKCIEGKKCFYMSFEESETRLMEHMDEFGWHAKQAIKEGLLKIQRINPFEITRNVDALLAKQKGELLIDVDPVILPKNFKPDFVVVDSLTAIASAFTGKEDSYRVYIEQLFRFFENLGSTNFLITETNQVPEIFSQTGVEEFLADGVIVFYNFKKGDVREKGIEILKMRGEDHTRKIVALAITDKGIVVYPEQEVFSSSDTNF